MSVSPKAASPITAPEALMSPSQLRAAICEHTVDHCLSLFAAELKAVLLAGSMARDEATYISRDGFCEVLGDAEFLLICNRDTPLPSQESLNWVRGMIKHSLYEKGIRCPVSLDAAHDDYLSTMEPRIFAYELRTCGRVVWGDPNTLGLIPHFQPQDIPLEDAWRLLNNRIVEQVEIAGAINDSEAQFSRALQYQTVKLYLDMASSFLVFAGAYAPTYELRSKILNFLAYRQAASAPMPFPLDDFARNVQLCTEFKVGVRSTEISAGWRLHKSAIAHAWILWRWELAQLSKSDPWLSDRLLRTKWMRRQPLRARMRGWARTLRSRGWYRSWREWPRWLPKALQGSPRHWVYAAASELCFRLPWILESGAASEQGLDWQEIIQWLPVNEPASYARNKTSWQDLARAIAVNYHELMEKTCA
ncbi:MAG: hypothetical protein ACYDA9_18855 [Terriglobia bacterium]